MGHQIVLCIIFAVAYLYSAGEAMSQTAAKCAKLDNPDVLKFVFHPRRELSSEPASGKAIVRSIEVEKDVSIGCRFYIADPAAPAIVFFHGNGEIAADYDDTAPFYTRLGLNLLAVDYRGYGRSTGSPTATAMLRDSHFILEDIKKWRAGQSHTGKLYVMGRSLGSVSAIELAVTCPDDIEGLIIESGFAYTEPLLRFLGAPTRELGITEADCFGNLEKIKSYKKPLLVIHGQHDQFIPVSDAEALVKNSPSGRKQLKVIAGADHNSILRFAGPEYFSLIRNFISGN